MSTPRDPSPRLRGAALYAQKRRIVKRDGPLCQDCNAATPRRVNVGRELDHVVPLFKGGSLDDSNCRLLCVECHEIKTRNDLGQRIKGWSADGTPRDPAHPWATPTQAGSEDEEAGRPTRAAPLDLLGQHGTPRGAQPSTAAANEKTDLPDSKPCKPSLFPAMK